MRVALGENSSSADEIESKNMKKYSCSHLRN
jgi:hypothetical protein